MIEFIIYYIICAAITYLGLLYKYHVSNRWKGFAFRDKDWLLVFLPIVNFFMVYMTVILIIFDIALKISDFFEDNR